MNADEFGSRLSTSARLTEDLHGFGSTTCVRRHGANVRRGRRGTQRAMTATSAQAVAQPLPCPDCHALPCKHPKRALDDCCNCSGEVCGDRTCPAIELVTCEVCDRGDREDELLLCDGCDHACHLSCMRPPLRAIPALWFCQRCTAAAMAKRRRTIGAGGAAGGTPAGSTPERPLHSVPAGNAATVRGSGDDAGEEKGASQRLMVDVGFMVRLDRNKAKLCNCKKSRCLKQYCECFREKEFCSARCNCTGCLNVPGKHRCTPPAPAAVLRARGVPCFGGRSRTLLGGVHVALPDSDQCCPLPGALRSRSAFLLARPAAPRGTWRCQCLALCTNGSHDGVHAEICRYRVREVPAPEPGCSPLGQRISAALGLARFAA